MSFSYLTADFCCDPNPICWKGMYISGQLGQGWSRSHYKFHNDNYFNTLGSEVLGTKFNLNTCGFIGGGAIGYNFLQRECIVVGVEAGAIDLCLKKRRASPFFPDSDRYSSNLQWLADVKARIGYAHKKLLTFVTAGWVCGRSVLKLVDETTDITSRSKRWLDGWTVGAGFDYRLYSCLSLGAAYDYYELSLYNKTASCANCGTGTGLGTPKIKGYHQIQTLTFRLNYHFNLGRFCSF